MKIQEQTIKTVVSDFDGTLIKHGTHTPTERFYRLAGLLLSQDICFVAASGRQYPNLKRMLSPIADRIGYIAENGALVIWKGEVIYKAVIDDSLARELIADLQKEPDSEILVSGEGTSYVVPNDPQYAYRLEHQVKNVVQVLEDFRQVPEGMLKISIYYPGGIPRKAELDFHARYDDRLLVVESGNGWLDFMHRESGKGNALRVLSEKAGFSLKETVAFGDSENDISMLQTAGLSFAMSSARKEVQNAADAVCSSVEDILEYALAMHTLEQYILGLAQCAGESCEYAEDLWTRLRHSAGVLTELSYYHDYGSFLCRYKVSGYTLADILVWQVDHFKAYLDRPDAVNRYRQERLVLKAFDIMLQMEQHPQPFIDKMSGETGTDFVDKY